MKLKKILLAGLIIISVSLIYVFFVSVPKKTIFAYEKSIVFTKDGNVSEYQKTGFSNPETNATWTDGKEATVTVPVPQIPENYSFFMSLDASPFLAKKIKKQVVDVFVNDTKITVWTMDKPGIYTVLLPQDVVKNQNDLNIKFKISNPKSPKELKLQNDKRKLGVFVKELRLLAVNNNNLDGFSKYNIGDEIDFTGDGNSKSYVISGFSAPEKDFTWTDGDDALIGMFTEDIDNKSLSLVVSGHGVYDNKKMSSQDVMVYVNDKEIAVWNVTNADNTYSVVLPQDVLETNVLKIRFHINSPFSPGADTRRLGFAVKNLMLKQNIAAKTKIKIARWLKNKVLKVPVKENTDTVK